MRNMISNLEELWCQTMHDATMWPIHGRYRCGTCLREYAVPFAEAEGRAAAPGIRTEALASRA